MTNDYLHISFPLLLPHKGKEATDVKKENTSNILYNKNNRKIVKEAKDYLDLILPRIDVSGLPTDEPYYMICCNCYADSMGRMTDVDNTDYSKVMNHIIKTLRFIPDDSPDDLSVIILGVVFGKCINKWVEEHVSSSGTSHTELFFIPKSRIGMLFREDG